MKKKRKRLDAALLVEQQRYQLTDANINAMRSNGVGAASMATAAISVAVAISGSSPWVLLAILPVATAAALVLRSQGGYKQPPDTNTAKRRSLKRMVRYYVKANRKNTRIEANICKWYERLLVFCFGAVGFVAMMTLFVQKGGSF